MNEKIVKDLEKIVGKEGISTSPADKISYGRDMWPRNLILLRCGVHKPYSADAVVWPSSPAQVASLVRYCARAGIKMVPYGAGSGVCGGAVPKEGGVVIDLKRLSAIGEVDPRSLTVDVQAGAIGQIFEEELNRQGFTAGHFPASIYCSTVGGWIATRGAGQMSSLYGKIEDIAVRLRVVTMDGEITEAAGFPWKGPGPSWLQVFLGSEGTLGIIVEARLKVHRLPERRSMRAVKFPSLATGIECAREAMQAGLRPAVLRLYDPLDTLIFRSLSGRGLPEPLRRWRKELMDAGTNRAIGFPRLVRLVTKGLGDRISGGVLLMAGFEGDGHVVEAELNQLLSIVKKFRGADLGEEPGNRWLEHRYSVSYKMSQIFTADCFTDTMEVSVPWDRAMDVYRGVLDAVSPYVVGMAHFSHAYPHGCSIYFTFAGTAPTDEESLYKYDSAWKVGMKAVLRGGGSLSHHHGIGILKSGGMREELGGAYDVLVQLKNVFDPEGLLNPGKLVT